MRIGIGIGEIGNRGDGLDGVVAQARRAEAEGFASVWVANITGLDAMTTVALCGRETERIELGTAVVPTYPRHPYAMAQQAMSTQAACGNRFTLGIGLSHQVMIEGMLGMSWARPFSHMKAYVEVLAPLIREGNANVSNSEFQVNAPLSVPGAKPCPILLAALAPKMLALAGSVADGTATWMTGPTTLRNHVVPRIREAAAGAGRPAPRIVAGLPVAVHDDADEARERAATVFQMYGFLPSYRAMLDREGAEGPAQIAVVGNEDAVAEQIENLAGVGITDFLAAPFTVGADKEASYERTWNLLTRLAAAHT